MSGNVAIVTGGSRGIGRAVVQRLVDKGHIVLFTLRTSPHDGDLERTLGGSIIPFRCDITDPDAPARIFDAAQAVGEASILVNNAGVTGRIGPLRASDDDTLRRVIDVNLTATIRLCREAVTRWEWREPGDNRCIVNVSSVAARTGAPGEYVWYAAAKAGVEALTVGLAKEVAPQGVRVNAVCPGTTDTGIHALAGRPDRAQTVGARAPLGRPGRPDEIAAAVEWLASAEASYVTGAVLTVSGGV